MNKYCLFGAAPNTGNLGVSALCFGVLQGLSLASPGSRVTVFDYGRGRRGWDIGLEGVDAECVGAYHTKRLWRPECLRSMLFAAGVGGLGNLGVGRIRGSSAVLDISGGDSFTDLYGAHRFAEIASTKRLALRVGVPLVLLPQTYGPFRGARERGQAAEIVRRATMCWARDERSFEILKDLLGGEFDPLRHRCGVDVAFLLGVREPGSALARPLDEWLGAGDGRTVGFNVSGLIYMSEDGGRAQYGLRADYRGAVERFVGRVLERTDARVMLMPHVIAPEGHYESDNEACARLCARLGAMGEGRVATAPSVGDPREAKWLISKMSWFCGTRMHSTIAGLSTGVPTAAIAYSDKTRGVFETCGQGEHVADPRELDTDGLVEALWASFEARERARATLASALPGVLGQAEEQMRSVCEVVRRSSEDRAA